MNLILMELCFQELEIVIGDEHISFTTSKIGSLVDVNQSRDPDGLRCFYYLVQEFEDFIIIAFFPINFSLFFKDLFAFYYSL